MGISRFKSGLGSFTSLSSGATAMAVLSLMLASAPRAFAADTVAKATSADLKNNGSRFLSAVTSAGQVVIQVLERETKTTPEKDYVSVGGTYSAQYHPKPVPSDLPAPAAAKTGGTTTAAGATGAATATTGTATTTTTAAAKPATTPSPKPAVVVPTNLPSCSQIGQRLPYPDCQSTGTFADLFGVVAQGTRNEKDIYLSQLQLTSKNGTSLSVFYDAAKGQTLPKILEKTLQVKTEGQIVTDVSYTLVEREVKMSEILDAAKQGVTLTLILTQDGSEKPELVLYKLDPYYNAPVKDGFTSIGTAFRNPVEILDAPTDATLASLRKVSSATAEYHEELLAILAKANRLDLARLEMLMDSVYCTRADFDQFQTDYRTVMANSNLNVSSDPGDGDFSEARNIAAKTNACGKFAPYLTRLLVEGYPKLTAVTYEQSIALVKKLFPVGARASAAPVLAKIAQDFLGKNVAAATVVKRRSELIELALSKKETAFAIDLAGDEFAAKNDFSVKGLLAVANRFEPLQREAFLKVQRTRLAGQIALSDALALVFATPNSALDTAIFAASRMGQNLTVDAMAQLALQVRSSERPQLIAKSVNLIVDLSAKNASQLVDVAGTDEDATAIREIVNRGVARQGPPR